MSKIKSVAEKFHTDPRLAEAKKLIQAALLDHQKEITGVKAPNPELVKDYDQLIKDLSANRGGALFYRYIGTGFGKGPFVELCDGSVKYDFITGIGVHYFGHSDPGLVASMVDGAISNTTMQGHLQQNIDSHKLISLLVAQATKNGANLPHCFLTSSGVMAIENALKACLQKKSPASRVLAFERCFHGRTMAVSQITDKAAYREGLPENFNVDYLPFYNPEDHQGSIEKTIYTLKKYLKRHPNQYAAMVMELIQGEAGSFVGNKEYFEALIKVLKENNISVIVDEVQTFGRTQDLFAFQYFGLDKLVDVVTIGKMSQVCATFFRDDYKPKPGLLSQTFTSSSAAISASYYIISQLIEKNYLGKDGKINQLFKHFSTHLEALAKKHPTKIKGPYGIGAMVAMTVFNGDAEKSKQFSYKLFDNGVLSFMAGGDPTRVRFLMPIGAMELNYIDEVVSIIDKTLQSME